MNTRQHPFDRFAGVDDSVDANATSQNDRSIGELISDVRDLAPDQIERIVAYQKQHGIRFGEAAIALGLASGDDVLHALSRQFDYDYASAPIATDASRELVVATSPFSDEAEAFRELRSQLIMGALADRETRSALAVLSPDRGDGKTYIAANLAIAFSQLGNRTLLVDADMRTPRQHGLFALEGGNVSGLSSVLSGRSDGHAIQRVSYLPNLFVMPVGATPPNPLELLQHPAFGLLLLELWSKFDYVIIDTPAATHGSDARVIAARAGTSLVVGRQGGTRMASMKKLLKHLAKGPSFIAGVVMNDH